MSTIIFGVAVCPIQYSQSALLVLFTVRFPLLIDSVLSMKALCICDLRCLSNFREAFGLRAVYRRFIVSFCVLSAFHGFNPSHPASQLKMVGV